MTFLNRQCNEQHLKFSLKYDRSWIDNILNNWSTTLTIRFFLKKKERSHRVLNLSSEFKRELHDVGLCFVFPVNRINSSRSAWDLCLGFKGNLIFIWKLCYGRYINIICNLNCKGKNKKSKSKVFSFLWMWAILHVFPSLCFID